jgi:hypothetical protein
MREIVHGATGELIRPGRFLRRAAQALRISPKLRRGQLVDIHVAWD